MPLATARCAELFLVLAEPYYPEALLRGGGHIHQLEMLFEAAVLIIELAIEVGRALLRAEAATLPAAEHAQGRSPLQGHVLALEHMAIQDAGTKVAARHGLHVANAIDLSLIPAGPFWDKRWPALREPMSPANAAGFAPPGA